MLFIYLYDSQSHKLQVKNELRIFMSCMQPYFSISYILSTHDFAGHDPRYF